MADLENNSNYHNTVAQDLQQSQTRVTLTATKQGAYDDLLSLLTDARFDYDGEFKGENIIDTSNLMTPNDWGAGAICIRLADCRLSRAQGGRGVLTATVEATRGTCAWGIDFTEVQKDIRTWRQGEKEEKNRPDLAVIASWEALKGDTAHAGAYQAYTYYEGETPKTIEKGTPTRDLADMILRGIETYSLWIPVISCTATSFNTAVVSNAEWGSVGEKLGKVYTPAAPVDAFDSVGGVTAGDILSKLTTTDLPAVTSNKATRVWILTADRLTVNGDGSFTRNIQWTGFDHAEEKLYGKAANEGGI